MNGNIEFDDNNLVVMHRTPKGIESFNRATIKNNNNNPIGCKLRSNNYGWFKVIRKTNKKYEIEFIETGYKYDIDYYDIIIGNVKDPLYKSICNIACLGKSYKKFKIQYPELYRTLQRRYISMIKRCYNPNNPNYHIYGALGCTVSEDWKNFSNYLYDILGIIHNMDNPEEIIEGLISGELEIDKDIKQRGIKEKVYSKDTVSIVSGKDNCQIENRENWEVIHFKYAYLKDDKPVWKLYGNIRKFAREYNLDRSNICKCLNNELSHTGDYIFRYLTDEEYSLLKSLGFPDNYELGYVSEDILNKKYFYKSKINIFAYADLKDDKPMWKSYNGARIFEKQYGVYHNMIYACLNGKRFQTHGYIFRWLSDKEYSLLESLGFPDNYELGYVSDSEN